MFCDFKALSQSVVINLAITAIWYFLEYKQFGQLQWNRKCDNIVWIIYVFVIWWALHK